MNFRYAPLRKTPTTQKPWEGDVSLKPWDFQVTAAIPVLDTWETLEVVVELLRAQTNRPFIMVIDTGSLDENLRKIEAMRDEDLEVHVIRLNAVKHPSDFPAMAMDLAMTLCRTPYMFATHADCFLKKQTLLEEMVQMVRDISPVVGYEITPRAHDDWRGMVSHTCTMMDMKVMDEIGAGWSMRRLATLFNLEDHFPDPMRPNWPDTELLLNYILRDHDITPFLIGHEENFARNTDENIDHCRTLTGGMLYSSTYYAKAQEWVADAIAQAKERLRTWKANG